MDQFLNQPGRWLRGTGAENDIVVSSRIRLARNLAGYPFVVKAREADRELIESTVRREIPNIFDATKVEYVDIAAASPLDRQFLIERQLVSSELVEGEGARSVIIDLDERFSVMLNEEDHLRIQAMTSGYELEDVWNCINELDDRIEDRVHYAFGEKYGYLTACPTNVGTGMRVSVMLHLPALVVTKEIEKVFRSLQKVNLAVRGMYGEGSQSLGDFYQISNQITLGHTEEAIIQRFGDILPQIVSYERQAREFLLKEQHESILDRSSRALGVLGTARTIGTEEAMHHLSSLRIGINTGLIDSVPIETVNELLLLVQPAHLQKQEAREMQQSERDIARAKKLRERLGNSR